jgi:AraC-like DNA-binding protein
VLHLRAETEQRLRVSFVSLTHEPDDRADLERLLGCPVRARAAWAGVEFPTEVAQLPLRRRDSTLRRVLEAHAAGIAAPAPAEKSVVAAARAGISSRIGAPPSLNAIARQLAIAPRTLQRRLADDGVTYQQLVDLVRRETAERLLRDATLGVSEIGYLLGFSEPSAFHRAFKRWHEVTPQEYRRRVQASKEQSSAT